jgi:hypothetical protein
VVLKRPRSCTRKLVRRSKKQNIIFLLEMELHIITRTIYVERCPTFFFPND